MMQCLLFFSAVLIQCSLGNGSPGPDGVGVFAYEDSAGHRYECVYKPRVNQVTDSAVPSNTNKINEVTSDNENWPSRRFLPPLPPLPPLKPLSPFKPLEPLPPLPPLRPLRPLPRPFSPFHWLPPLRPLNNLRDAIFNNIENQQRAAFEAAQNSFHPFNAFPYIPYIPNFNFRFPPNDQFNYFGPSNPASVDMSGINSAFASGAVGPGFRHQVAAISPENPQVPNVDVSRQYPVDRNMLNNRFYSVSSSSYASSLNDNGQTQRQRGAETIVNDNGKITKYSVRN